MGDFNPFGMPLSKVSSGEIYSLTAPEGLYIDYKRSLVEKDKIAKAVSAFANTYGGFLIVGIEEDPKTNEPDQHFLLDESTKKQETIRSAIVERIQPVPDFSTKAVQGKNPDGDDGWVILVQVPESSQTPHIHYDGRVYRRRGESSNPLKFEEDPAIIDRLHERKRRWEEKRDDFCNTNNSITEYQAGGGEGPAWPVVELYFAPSTLGEPVCSEVITEISEFKSIVEESEWRIASESEDIDGSVGMSVSSIRTTSNGVEAQIGLESPAGDTILHHTPGTIRFFNDGGMKVFQPISRWTNIDWSAPPWRQLNNRTAELDQISLVNPADTLSAIISFFNSHVNLLDRFGWFEREGSTMEFKARISNSYRMLPVYEEPWYDEFIRSHGIPVCYEEEINLPRHDPYPIRFNDDREVKDVYFYIWEILSALGIPGEFVEEGVVSFEF